jgi:hypothetical protein
MYTRTNESVGTFFRREDAEVEDMRGHDENAHLVTSRAVDLDAGL